MDRAGGRRGLARRTRETYGRWAARYARWAGGARAVMEQGRGQRLSDPSGDGGETELQHPKTGTECIGVLF